ncbi:MAG: glycosyltransferase [Coriobacteriia bacterium]|nr:glycosyltransferase [Coriobacteriia bacterium]
MDAVVAIPALNPDAQLVELVDALHERGFARFIVVDDGSGAEAQPVFQSLERRGVRVVRHAQNLGKGSALKTALAQMRFAYPDARHLVSVDADGQHVPDDVVRVCRHAEEHPQALVLGTRDFSKRGVPMRSRIGNGFSALYFRMDTGVACADTQTGLRVIPRPLFRLALSTKGARYDYEMNFLTAAAKGGHDIQALPIRTVYRKGNTTSHFRTVRDSLLIYRTFVRFAGSSLACSLVDLAMFALLTAIVSLDTAVVVAVATIVARMLSGMLNFELNRSWSFAASGSMRGDAHAQAVRYGVLFVAQMLASMGLVTVFSFLPVPLVAVKVLVDGSLFFVSHFVQKNWVFKANARAVKPLVLKGGAHVRNARAA